MNSIFFFYDPDPTENFQMQLVRFSSTFNFKAQFATTTEGWGVEVVWYVCATSYWNLAIFLFAHAYERSLPRFTHRVLHTILMKK